VTYFSFFIFHFSLILGRAPASQGRHLTGFASLMASPPLRGPPGGSRKNLVPEAKTLQKIVKETCGIKKRPYICTVLADKKSLVRCLI
jgi:hypothetical protein